MSHLSESFINYDEELNRITIQNKECTFEDIYNALEVLDSSVLAEIEASVSHKENNGKANPNENAYANANSNASFLRDGTNYVDETTGQVLRSTPAGVVRKCGNHYTLDCDLHLNHGAYLHDEDIGVLITGEYFQLQLDSKFRLGNIDPQTGRTFNGCHFVMPNVKLEYGFGQEERINDATQSGDCYLYDCLIDVDCFWGFFKGPDQHCEVIDCNINGFGRIEGTESIIRNVVFEESHPRFGVISPKGQLKEYSNITTLKSTDCSTYFNPKLADDMRVLGGVYDGYRRLVYCESSLESKKTVTFVDADIRGNYAIKLARNAFLNISHSFKPYCIDKNGDRLSGIGIAVYNAQEEIVHEQILGDDGYVDAELCIYSSGDQLPPTNHFPFVIRAYKEGAFHDEEKLMTTIVLDMEKPIKDVPLVLCDDIAQGETEIVYIDSGTGGFTVKEDAIEVIYINTPRDSINNERKAQVMSHIPDTSTIGRVYTDTTRDAYSYRPSYDNMMMECLAGNIKRIYVWEAESFGHTRKDLTCAILDQLQIEVVETRDL